MNNRESVQQVHAIVIGRSTDKFVRCACKLFCDYEIDYTLCEDVYSAVGLLAENGYCGVLVIGRFESLSKEKGWILRKAVHGDFFCCCLVESAEAWRKTTAFKGPGIFIINDVEEIEAVVMKVLKDGSVIGPRIEKISSAVFSKEKFAASKAEISALLGI